MAFTKMQELAVNGEFKNCLVSASAGSGKTFVMISRVLRLILEERASVDEFLCVTFTELAARELKKKLSDAIAKEVEKSEGKKREYLLEQLELLPTANVCTIHAFCKNLLKEFFYCAGVQADFKIIDANETKILANRAIDRLFEDLYDSTDEHLSLLLPLYFKKRSDGFLKEAVLETYESLISEANPMEILKGGESYYCKEGAIKCINAISKEFKDRAKQLREEALRLTDEVADSKYKDFLGKIVELLARVSQANSVYEMRERLAGERLIKPSVTKASTDVQRADDDKIAPFYRGEFAKFKKTILELELEDEQSEIDKAEDLLPVYQAFSFLVSEFACYFRQEKDEENALDFSDLEHFTLQMLGNEDVRAEVSQRFKFLFTDEYQDTSGVQEAILTKIANDNLFMVGDLKQSIYNFRGCNPQIFDEKYKKYSLGEGGTAINLDVNFRSTSEVLRAVNNLFSCVMTKDFGSVDYKASPMQFGGNANFDNGKVEMHVVKRQEKNSSIPEGVYSVINHLQILNEGKGFAEGKRIAEIIEELVGRVQIPDKKGGYRYVGYGDVAILLRSANAKADKYASELIRAGIPLSANTKNSIAEYAEVDFAINLLRLIETFNQDIPLVSTLKSVVGNLDESELLKIRQNHKKGSFFEAYFAYFNESEEDRRQRLILEARERDALLCEDDFVVEQRDACITQKLVAFDTYLKRIQTLSEFLPCDEILTTVIREKGIDSHLLCSKMGEIKLERLNRLVQACSQKKQTVREFLYNIERTLETVTINYNERDAVQIMSIHASKGLEFPIVILAGVNGIYSTEDVKGDFITDKNYGVALEYKNLSTMKRKNTALRIYLKMLKKKRMQEEELRLLYVAMTRAEQHLYITAEYSGNSPQIKYRHGSCDGLYANSFYQLFARPDLEIIDSKGELSHQIERQPQKQVLISSADEQLKQEIWKNLNFKYSFDKDVYLPVKSSVTALNEAEEGEEYEYAPIYAASSEEKGTAYHHYLELCDFNRDAVEQFKEFCAQGKLNDSEIALLEPERLEKILKMPIFKRLEGYTLYKEHPFTLLIPAKQIEQDYQGDAKVLVQGIIDLLAIKGNRAVIVDYKFSTIKWDEHLLKKYKKQLNLYAYAVKEVLKLQIEGVYIANVYNARLVEVEGV